MNTEIRDRLLRAMKAAGYSYSDLAQMTGISKSSLQRYFVEKPEKMPINYLTPICKALGLKESDVLGWSAQGNEDDSWAIRDKLRADPELRVLFDAADGAKPEHLRAAVAMLRALKAKEEDNGS